MMALAWVSVALVGATAVVSSLAVGRCLLNVLVSMPVKHDVYAFGIGFSICSGVLEAVLRLRLRLREQASWRVAQDIANRLLSVGKCAVVGFVMGGLVPLLTGMLLDLLFVVPLRCTLYQTPELLGPGQWMGGALAVKVLCRLLVNTPSLAPLCPRVRQGLVNLTHRGWQNVHLVEFFDTVALPVITHLVLFLSSPYLLAWTVLPLWGARAQQCVAFWRWMYPCVTMLMFATKFVRRTGRALAQVHGTLRDSLYLVGRQLHNLPE